MERLGLVQNHHEEYVPKVYGTSDSAHVFG